MTRRLDVSHTHTHTHTHTRHLVPTGSASGFETRGLDVYSCSQSVSNCAAIEEEEMVLEDTF